MKMMLGVYFNLVCRSRSVKRQDFYPAFCVNCLLCYNEK